MGFVDGVFCIVWGDGVLYMGDGGLYTELCMPLSGPFLGLGDVGDRLRRHLLGGGR